MPALTEKTVLAVIKSTGVFQINPLSYRNEKTTKILKSMTKKGLVTRQKVNGRVVNYTLPSTN